MHQINGNLKDENRGLKNYIMFCDTADIVWNYFVKHVGSDTMDSIDVFIDNATAHSGYTPNITPVLKKYLIIKLNIESEYNEGVIAYQLSHELMHFVFYTKYGIDKEMADEREESICSAASLTILYNLYPEYFELQNKHVKTLSNNGYRKGASIAYDKEYNFEELLKMV